MRNYMVEDWLTEAEMPMAGGQSDQTSGGPPTTDTYGSPMAQNNSADMGKANGDPDVANQGQEPEDVNNDPSAPHMPDEKQHVDDFDVWKNSFLRESIKGDTGKLVDLIHQIRDKEGLKPYQSKFIEDNWNIQLLRQNANIDKATKDIRRNIKDQLDRNNPATTVVNHMVSVLDTIPILNNIFIKLSGYGSLKSDLHRKFIASLIGGVQVGSGANTEDLIYNEKDYSILISTRFNSEWGEVIIGSWNMKDDDIDKYLAEPEKKRLEEGSPEEKDVLRRRVILESITHQYGTRSFIINVSGDDGTVYTVGWDISSSLKAAYADGKIIVKTTMDDAADGMITDEGKVVSFMNLDIYYAKETGQQKEDGSPEIEEIPFIQKRNGQLFLTAELKTIKEASSSMQGLVFKETPYNGNPSDLKVLTRCVYTSHDLLMKLC